MADKAPDLYRELSESSLIIFKGDYNYRKMVSDLEWPLDTPFKVILIVNFVVHFALLRVRKISKN